MKYKILPILAFSLFALLAQAQVKFYTVINETAIGLNDYVQVQYVVENAETIRSMTAPVFKGFNIVSGPSQQSGMTIINGTLTKYESIAYMLKPLATGKFIITGATAVINGKGMKSNNVTIQVSKQAKASLPVPVTPFDLDDPATEQVNEDFILSPGENLPQKIKKNLLVKLDVSKTSCYEGEPVIATYKLYSRLKSESKVTRRPSLDGFSVYDMLQSGNTAPTVEKMGGKPFNVHIIRKVQLYPLQPGKFTLDAMELDNSIRFIKSSASSNNMQGLLDGFIDGDVETHNISLASEAVTITAKPLPSTGRPLNFDGAVGKFQISASTPVLRLPAGESGKLFISISGEGNLPLINAPAIVWPEGMEVFEPVIKEETDKTVAPIKGTKTFEYSFTCNKEGSLQLPAVGLSYFDPAANSYKSIKTDSIVLLITKAVAPQKSTGNNKLAERKQTGFSWTVVALIIAGLVLTGLVFFVTRKRERKSLPHVEQVIKMPEPETDLFALSRKALHEGNSTLFYKETGNVLWKALAEKLKITSSQLNKPVVLQLLQQKGFAADRLQQVENVLLDCELALYTPVHSEKQMMETLTMAELVVLQLKTLS